MDEKEKALRKKFQKHIEKTGIHFNPDTKKVDEVVKTLLMRQEKFGEPYCPCRIITKNKDKDKEIICPCVFHRGEIELEGHCLCTLFVR